MRTILRQKTRNINNGEKHKKARLAGLLRYGLSVEISLAASRSIVVVTLIVVAVIRHQCVYHKLAFTAAAGSARNFPHLIDRTRPALNGFDDLRCFYVATKTNNHWNKTSQYF